jgi:hypothetical protein
MTNSTQSLTVRDLAHKLLSQNPQENAARLAFYHYLKNFRQLDESVTSTLVQQFYGRALCFPFWQKNKLELAAGVKKSLDQFPGIENVRHADELQVLKIENIEDLQRIVLAQTQPLLREIDRLRILEMNSNENEETSGVIRLILRPEGQLEVTVFDRWALIDGAILAPLCNDRTIIFNSKLEVAQGAFHHIELSSYTTARFNVSNQSIEGHIIKGYTFQKVESLQAESIEKIGPLFYAVKSLEKYFVNRATDPMYREVVKLIENSIQMLTETRSAQTASQSLSIVEMKEMALQAFDRGQQALQYLFPDDKVLFLLLRDLARTLAVSASAAVRAPDDNHPPTSYPPLAAENAKSQWKEIDPNTNNEVSHQRQKDPMYREEVELLTQIL